MRKLIGVAVFVALLSFVSPAFGAVGVNNDHDSEESYVGEASNICIEGQEVSFDGSQVTILANGHKEGVTTNVSTESNLTSAALAYGVVEFVIGSTKYVNLADGTPGQMVTFTVTTAGGGTLYITNDKVSAATSGTFTGWDDIAFDSVLDNATLLYVDDTIGWVIIGQNAVTVT
jgi:hypothetical protein